MADVVNVVVRGGKCYTCVLARTEAGFYVDSEPVFIADVNADELLAALQRVLALDHPSIPTPTKEGMRTRAQIIPSAAGVSSWKELAQKGAAYSIQWNRDDTTKLLISRLDKKGRFVWEPGKTRSFAANTPLGTVVEAILEDVNSRHELLNSRSSA